MNRIDRQTDIRRADSGVVFVASGRRFPDAVPGKVTWGLIWRIGAIPAVWILLVSGTLCAQEATRSPEIAGTSRLVEKVRLTDAVVAEDRLIQVPENRGESASRTILVHYIRIPAQTDTELPPVVLLPGGPGSSIVCADLIEQIPRQRYSRYAEIAAYSEVRDVLIINQRGASGTPGGPALPRYWLADPPDLLQPRSFDESAARLSRGLRDALRECEDQGFDTRGYNLTHLVDDVEAVRKAHGYEQLAFRGASFGSQWALAYLRRYPANVERLLLSGVEPVDFGYDSPEGIWNVIQRVEADARDATGVDLPGAGLAEAIREIAQRLERTPVRVQAVHPRRHFTREVRIGADDFRQYLLRPILDSRPHSRKMLAYWPKFVAEIYHGDYRYLASRILDDRPERKRHSLLLTLVDNSIGISPDRESHLESQPARKWIGDVNWFYRATRPACPPDPNAAELRGMVESRVPLLLIQGTLDLATPFENATELVRYFPNGRLLTVVGGTHAADWHAASVDPQFLSHLKQFMNASDESQLASPRPLQIRLPELDFANTGGRSLFEMLTGDQAGPDPGKY